DGEMRFAYAARADQQQAMFAAERKFLGEARHNKLRLREATVPGLELLARDVFDFIVRLEIFEIAVAIAFGDASASQRALGAVARGAIARNGPDHFGFAHRGSVWFIQRERLRAFRRPLDDSPAAALANGTICSRHEGSLASAAANSN